jgi:16S rRNA (adenine1518-N6/adenine1519-N6)-dimethyltransferase
MVGGMTRKPKLGQNFLVDDGAGQAIADSLGPLDGRTVIEIGPGHGAITEILAGRCRRLIAIEIDRALAAELRFRFREQAQVEIVEADVLDVDLEALLRPGETAEVVGNLPYYITSEILMRLLAAGERGQLIRAVLMLQREVAYGLLSATAQMSARIETLFTLPPTAFSPQPEVFSTVLRLEFASRFHALGVDPKGFDRFLRSCFAQKRKTLANNLRAAGYPANELQAAWPQDIPALARAESIPLEPMAMLYRALNAAGLGSV